MAKELRTHFCYNVTLQRLTPTKHITVKDEQEYTYIQVPNNFTMEQLNMCANCMKLLQCKMSMPASIDCYEKRV